MTLGEKILYHQIHPVKLITDVSVALASTYLFWQHMIITAILLAVIPPLLVSMILIKNGRLERYRDSAFGHYMKRYMDSRLMDISRLGGFVIMALGGWYHSAWFIGVGLLTVAVCWSNGFLFQRNAA
jgi:hypothetical protein